MTYEGVKAISEGLNVPDREQQQDPLSGIDIPMALQASVVRHRTNLAKLVSNLKSVGMSEEKILDSVSTIMDSYKQELMTAIRALMEDDLG